MELEAGGMAARLLSIQIICILCVHGGLGLLDLLPLLLRLVLAVDTLSDGILEPSERLLDFTMKLRDPDGDITTDDQVKFVAFLAISDHKGVFLCHLVLEVATDFRDFTVLHLAMLEKVNLRYQGNQEFEVTNGSGLWGLLEHHLDKVKLLLLIIDQRRSVRQSCLPPKLVAVGFLEALIGARLH